MLFSLLIGFRWWEKYPLAAIILGFCYFFVILAYDHAATGQDTLFEDVFKRLRDWRDYYSSKEFIHNRYDYNHAPLSNGDYLCLGKKDELEYMRFSYIVYRDFNTLYDLKAQIIDIKFEEIKYCIRKNEVSGLSELLYDLQSQLNADGYVIKAVYNQFGGCRWKQSDNPIQAKKFRKYLYMIAESGWFIATIVAFFLPLIPIIKL